MRWRLTVAVGMGQALAVRRGFRCSSVRRILRSAPRLSEPTWLNVTRASDTERLDAEADAVAADFSYPHR